MTVSGPEEPRQDLDRRLSGDDGGGEFRAV